MRTSSTRSICATALFACMALATPVWAGIADTPLPEIITGKPAKLLFSVSGVVASAGLDTVITCTSLERTSTQVGVEFFDSNGSLQNNVLGGDGELSVNPGETETFATGIPAALGPVSQVVTSFPGVGSARVVGYSAKLLCSARLFSHTGFSFDTLTIVKAKAQKGD